MTKRREQRSVQLSEQREHNNMLIGSEQQLTQPVEHPLPFLVELLAERLAPPVALEAPAKRFRLRLCEPPP